MCGVSITTRLHNDAVKRQLFPIRRRLVHLGNSHPCWHHRVGYLFVLAILWVAKYKCRILTQMPNGKIDNSLNLIALQGSRRWMLFLIIVPTKRGKSDSVIKVSVLNTDRVATVKTRKPTSWWDVWNATPLGDSSPIWTAFYRSRSKSHK